MLATVLSNASLLLPPHSDYMMALFGFRQLLCMGTMQCMRYKRGFCPFRHVLTPANCVLAVSPTLLNKNILPAVLFYKEPW